MRKCVCVSVWRERERERDFFFLFCRFEGVSFSVFAACVVLHFSTLNILNKNERAKRRATAELFTARMRFVSWQRDDDDDDNNNNNNNNNHEY